MAIVTYAEQNNDEYVLGLLNPLVAKWLHRFKALTPPQKAAIPLILQGRSVLIASPTGSGKTLAAFTGIMSWLADLVRKGELEDRVYCVYISSSQGTF